MYAKSFAAFPEFLSVLEKWLQRLTRDYPIYDFDCDSAQCLKTENSHSAENPKGIFHL